MISITCKEKLPTIVGLDFGILKFLKISKFFFSQRVALFIQIFYMPSTWSLILSLTANTHIIAAFCQFIRNLLA